MLDTLAEVLRLTSNVLVLVAVAVALWVARDVLRRYERKARQRDKENWRTDVIARINTYLMLCATRPQTGSFDVAVLSRPHRNPAVKSPYYAVSVADLDASTQRVRSLASHDVVEPHLVDALVDGLGRQGLGQLARDREWLMANTMLGGATDAIEQRSHDLVAAASVPPSELDRYRFALLRHEPFIVWVYLHDAKAGRRKA